MATDTVPAAVPGPPEPPGSTATNNQPAQGFLASMVAAVEPARPTFDLTPATGTGEHPAEADGALDRSAPGTTSASFRDATDQAAKNGDPAGARHKRSIWKEMWLAAATRWAKGGGTANKRLDLAKVRAQAAAHQVKESRTTTVMKSPGLPVRNTGGSGSGVNKGSGKADRNSAGKGPSNSSGNRSGDAGSGGSGGGSGSNGSGKSDKAAHRDGPGLRAAVRERAADRIRNGRRAKEPKESSGQVDEHRSGSGVKDKDGAVDSKSKAGPKGKHASGHTISHTCGGDSGIDKKPTKKDKDKTGKSGPVLADGGKPEGSDKGADVKTDKPDLEKTPLEKSREIGHKDGSAIRDVVDHVKAYVDGGVDGWHDKKAANAKEHERLDKAHDKHKTAGAPKSADQSQGAPKHITGTSQGQQVVIEDDNEPMEDPFMGKATPIQAKGIDTDKLTFGDGFLKPSIKRSELRTFKQYEDRLESRIDGLARVADATKALAAQAREQADECLKLLEEAKSVKGGDKVVGELNKLADNAKAQADEADEVHSRALKAHDFGKSVLSNVQTRYTPLYQAVVDSDEVKPAELRFYKDRGIYPSDTALAA